MANDASWKTREKARRAAILLAAFLCTSHSIAFAARLPDTIEQIKPAIVGIGTVQVTRSPPARLVGTGFVVADGRHAITNAHTLPERLDRRHQEYMAVLVPGDRPRALRAKVVETDLRHDLALLKFSGARLQSLKLGRSETVREGEIYAFTGFPIGMVLGMRPVTHQGIVSAITPIAIPQISGRHLAPRLLRDLQAPYDVFQLDATAYPGNSGSPLYDPSTGEVVGVINKVFVKESKENVLSKPSGISYAIPIEHARALLKKAGALKAPKRR